MDGLTLASSSAISRGQNDCPFLFCLRRNVMMGYSRIKPFYVFVVVVVSHVHGFIGEFGVEMGQCWHRKETWPFWVSHRLSSVLR